jgi:hypothetical protein
MEHYYERDVGTGIVRWEPDDSQLAYEAIVQCSATTPGTVAEAKTQCPIEISDGEHTDIQAIYADLKSSATSSTS